MRSFLWTLNSFAIRVLAFRLRSWHLPASALVHFSSRSWSAWGGVGWHILVASISPQHMRSKFPCHVMCMLHWDLSYGVEFARQRICVQNCIAYLVFPVGSYAGFIFFFFISRLFRCEGHNVQLSKVFFDLFFSNIKIRCENEIVKHSYSIRNIERPFFY